MKTWSENFLGKMERPQNFEILRIVEFSKTEPR